MELTSDGKLIDKITTYDEYLEDEDARKRQMVQEVEAEIEDGGDDEEE
jgi:hypothetical protein